MYIPKVSKQCQTFLRILVLILVSGCIYSPFVFVYCKQLGNDCYGGAHSWKENFRKNTHIWAGRVCTVFHSINKKYQVSSQKKALLLTLQIFTFRQSR